MGDKLVSQLNQLDQAGRLAKLVKTSKPHHVRALPGKTGRKAGWPTKTND